METRNDLEDLLRRKGCSEVEIQTALKQQADDRAQITPTTEVAWKYQRLKSDQLNDNLWSTANRIREQLNRRQTVRVKIEPMKFSKAIPYAERGPKEVEVTGMVVTLETRSIDGIANQRIVKRFTINNSLQVL